MVKSRPLKLHLKWIKWFGIIAISVLIYSCQSNYDLRNKLSIYLGDTKEVDPNNVCLQKVNGYLFAKQCNLDKYEIAIPISSLDKQTLDVVRLYNLNDIDYFFDCVQIFEMYKLDAIFFDKYPDTLNLIIYKDGILKNKILLKTGSK